LSLVRFPVRFPVRSPVRSVLGDVSGLAFSPDRVSGIQAWYDLPTSTSRWQDTGATVAATAPSDPIRLLQDVTANGRDGVAPSDAARGLYKAAAATGRAGYAAAMAAQPELVTNGTFDTDATGWTAHGSMTLSAPSGVFRIQRGVSINQNASTVLTCEVGKVYRVSFDYVGRSPDSTHYTDFRVGTTIAGIDLARTQDSSLAEFSTGEKSLTFVATATTVYIAVVLRNGASDDYIELDNVSVKEVPAAYLHRYVDYDGVDDVLNATLPNLGSTASVWYMKQDGTAVYAANQSISGAYALPAVDMRGLIIVDGPISASDQTKLATYYA